MVIKLWDVENIVKWPDFFLGILIPEELTVKPGTPLSMEIYLDNLSADIYGLMVSSLDVTDSIQSQESLIVNG